LFRQWFLETSQQEHLSDRAVLRLPLFPGISELYESTGISGTRLRCGPIGRESKTADRRRKAMKRLESISNPAKLTVLHKFHRLKFTSESDHRTDREPIIFEACHVRRTRAIFEFVIVILAD
jgi:hypothetical protein